jgi:protein TonB
MSFNISRRSLAPAAAAVLTWALCFGAVAADLAPLTKIDPEFPREAISAGAEKGRVKARMTVDSSGEVTRVEILDASPRRLFERVVIKTLSQWKFAPGGDGRLMEIEIDFHR